LLLCSFVFIFEIYGAKKIIECPRDAMQGIKPFIPTERKVAYIQSLLRVGFDQSILSFVSPKAIPQMQDTAAVLGQLDLSQTKANYSIITIPEEHNGFEAC
jgi:hypothetical protein